MFFFPLGNHEFMVRCVFWKLIADLHALNHDPKSASTIFSKGLGQATAEGLFLGSMSHLPHFTLFPMRSKEERDAFVKHPLNLNYFIY